MSAYNRDTEPQSKEMSTKKRSRKAYTKKSKKLEEELQLKNAEINSISEHKSTPDKQNTEIATNSVKFSNEVEEMGGNDDDSIEANNDCTDMNDINIARLTNKKKQYL